MVDLHNPHVIGTLTGADPGFIALDKIQELDTKVETIDSGSDGTIVMTADGTEVFNFQAATQTLGIPADTSIIISQAGNSITLEGGNVTSAIFTGNGSCDLYGSGVKVVGTISTGLQAGVAAFDIKTSGGEDGITINNNGAIELFHDNAKVSETTANGITGAVWG